MKFKASIDVMPLEALLDPQGKAVTQSMSNLGLNEISNVRIGKHITLFVEADNYNVLKSAEVLQAEELCQPILLGNKNFINTLAEDNGVDLSGIESKLDALSDKISAFEERLVKVEKKGGGRF